MPAATTPQRRNQPVRQAVPADVPTTVVSLVAGSAKATISRQSPQPARWSVTCARSESGSDFSAKAVSTSASGWRFDAFVGPCSRWRTILGRWGILAFGSQLLALSLEHLNINRTSFLRRGSFAPPGARYSVMSASHGLRPFDRLRASSGLHSYAARRLFLPVSLVRFSAQRLIPSAFPV